MRHLDGIRLPLGNVVIDGVVSAITFLAELLTISSFQNVDVPCLPLRHVDGCRCALGLTPTTAASTMMARSRQRQAYTDLGLDQRTYQRTWR